MTTLEFMAVYQDVELSKYIVTTAQRKAACDEDAVDYMQEAWIAISLADPQRTIDWYKARAYRAMDAASMKDVRRRRREVATGLQPWDAAGVSERTWYRKKKGGGRKAA